MRNVEHPEYTLERDTTTDWLFLTTFGPGEGYVVIFDRRLDVQDLHAALCEYLAETQCGTCDGTGRIDDLIDRQVPCPDCRPQQLSAGEVESFELAMDEQSHAEYRAAATAKAFDPDVPTEVWRAGYIAGVNRARSALSQQPERGKAQVQPVAYALTRDGEVCYEADDGIVISNTPGDETNLYKWQPVYFESYHPQYPDAGALVEALETARDYVYSALEERKHVLAGYPHKWRTEEEDLAAIDALIAAYRAQGKGAEG